MFGLSLGHIALFTLVLILLFGTSKIKSLGKDLGNILKDFKNSIQDDSTKDSSNSSVSKSKDQP